MAQTILVGITLLAYGTLLARYLPERWHIISNSLVSFGAVFGMLWAGYDAASLGIGTSFVLQGIVVAILISLAIVLVAAIVTRVTPLLRLVTLPQVIRPGKIAYETAVRIPLSTALSEEILFRGVLLAIALQHMSALSAMLVTSIVFGLWHVIPSARDHSVRATLPIVITTSVAGVFFAWLRLISGSIIAPWLVHWTVNASALLAQHVMSKKKHDSSDA